MEPIKAERGEAAKELVINARKELINLHKGLLPPREVRSLL